MGSLIINYELAITALSFLMGISMGSFSISPIHPTQLKHSIVTNIICIPSTLSPADVTQANLGKRGS